MTSDNSKPAADEQLLSLDELRDLWNAQVDAANSWDALGADEIVWWAQRQALVRAGLADGPAVPEGREPASVVSEPSDEELALIYHDCCRGCAFMDQGGFEDAARAVLARFGHHSPDATKMVGPAEGEVGDPPPELVHRWEVDGQHHTYETPLSIHIATQAARWGAAQVVQRHPAPVPLAPRHRPAVAAGGGAAMSDTNRPPLWKMMNQADRKNDWPRYIKAAEIRAVADAIPEEFYGASGVKAWLLEEADRAERGND